MYAYVYHMNPLGLYGDIWTNKYNSKQIETNLNHPGPIFKQNFESIGNI